MPEMGEGQGWVEGGMCEMGEGWKVRGGRRVRCVCGV